MLVQRAPGASPAVLARAGRDEGVLRRGLVARRPHRRRRKAQPNRRLWAPSSSCRWTAVNRSDGLQAAPTRESPRFSPDGRWVAYPSFETGTPEVYVRPFPPSAKRSACRRGEDCRLSGGGIGASSSTSRRTGC